MALQIVRDILRVSSVAVCVSGCVVVMAQNILFFTQDVRGDQEREQRPWVKFGKFNGGLSTKLVSIFKVTPRR